LKPIFHDNGIANLHLKEQLLLIQLYYDLWLIGLLILLFAKLEAKLLYLIVPVYPKKIITYNNDELLLINTNVTITLLLKTMAPNFFLSTSLFVVSIPGPNTSMTSWYAG